MKKEVNFLSGERFDPQANDIFRMDSEDFDAIDFASKDCVDLLERLVNQHKIHQLPRLKELKRYYLGNNNIKYRPPKTDEYAADNRIASDFAHYITIFEQGYMLGRPIQYKNEDTTLQEQINLFVEENNEAAHNVLIKTDLSIYGRAYELLTVERYDESSPITVKLTKLAPEQTFVVYDDSYHDHSLFGVNYYTIDYGEGYRKSYIVVYTKDAVYRYADDSRDKNSSMHFVSSEEHFLKGEPINEYKNNEDRTGSYEAVLDTIDAYDLSQSELANFQQDSVDAILVISGNPYTGADEKDFLEGGRINPNGRLGISLAFRESKMIILDDNPNPDGAKPDAKYLVKAYDSKGAEDYKKRLVGDILRFTFTPDTSDEHFGSNQSGESMKYKLMASDNLRAQQERLFKQGLMRRLRLAANIWSIKGNEATAYRQISQTSVIFTPNVPKSGKEVIEMAKDLYNVVSDTTVYEILNSVTGVSPEDELKRIKAESEDSETETAEGAGGEEDGEEV